MQAPRASTDMAVPFRGPEVWRSYSIYGLNLKTDFPLTSPLLPGNGPPDLTFTCRSEAPPEAAAAVPRLLRHSPHLLPSGESYESLYRTDGFDLIRLTEVVDFYLFEDRIVGHLLDPEYYYVVELRLLGDLLAYWCERLGTPMLHASGVVVDGRTVAFMATNQGGKSSLAAGLMQLDYPFLTDDVLRVRSHSDRYWADPGYPQMRFWPHDAERILGHYEDLELAHPNFSKRRVPVGPGGFGTICDEARPLACLYLPRRGEPLGSAIEIIDVPPSQRVIELIRGTFVPGWVKAAGLEQSRFELLGDLVANVPIRAIHYPLGFDHFPSVREAILRDVRSLKS